MEGKGMRWLRKRQRDHEELRAAGDWVRAALALDMGDPTETTLRLCARLQESHGLSPRGAVDLVVRIRREIEAARVERGQAGGSPGRRDPR